MVGENNLIRLREIRDKVIADNVNFESIDVSLATIDRVLRRQKMWMKQVYRVPFERDTKTYVTSMCKGYYSRTRWPDLMSTSSWMRLASTCRNEGKEAVTTLAKEPSLRFLANGVGGNNTLCAAMGSEGLVHRHAVLGSNNTQHLPTFLEELQGILLDHQQHHPGPAHHIYVIIWDNVRFHRKNQIRVVHQQQPLFKRLSATLLPFPEPYRGVLLIVEMEGL
ncbi:uncharacterized protein [Nothobranchius furzeri]|uniref:uncharacterized protein n=1 Tax=Nothobranchius furzeri TaxID=105023 RepID=UPI00077CDF3B